jgi:hypothetical protein
VSDNLVATWSNDNIVTTCWQACHKPAANTSCWQVASDNFVATWSNDNSYNLLTSLLQACCEHILLTCCEWQPCSNLIKWQHCYNLLTSLLQACCEHILLTSCEIFTYVRINSNKKPLGCIILFLYRRQYVPLWTLLDVSFIRIVIFMLGGLSWKVS